MRRLVLTALLATAGLTGAATAQPYPGGPAPYGPPRQARSAPVGYNCEAVQAGFSGFQPFSCPLPGARRLGARCFCDQPISPFSGVRPPLVGEVVP